MLGQSTAAPSGAVEAVRTRNVPPHKETLTMSAQRSKYLSMLLRHSPEKANLTLDKEGWCNLDQLLENTDFTIEELREIVSTDSKGRYSFGENAIRANQGHSISEIKLTFKKAIPPTILYHGTTKDAWEKIKKTGLLPMNRHHVHLTEKLETAKAVGSRRRSGLVVLEIDCINMVAHKVQFLLSDNGVWLVDKVEPKYIHLAED